MARDRLFSEQIKAMFLPANGWTRGCGVPVSLAGDRYASTTSSVVEIERRRLELDMIGDERMGEHRVVINTVYIAFVNSRIGARGSGQTAS